MNFLGMRHGPAALWACIFFSLLARVEAATINAASPSLANVATAVSSARDGDTVLIPAGTAIWTTGLSIKKAITLQGNGIGSTIIKDGIPNGTRLLSFTLVSGKPSRLTGIEFQNGGAAKHSNGVTGFVNAPGVNPLNGQTMRIDHCKFNGLNGNMLINSVIGVFDHNVIITNGGGYIAVWNSYWGGATTLFGDKSWTSPINFGGPDFFFIEDNEYIGTAVSTRSMTDGYAGARFVVRHNTITDGLVTNHGLDSSGRIRGGVAMEIYNNTFTQTSVKKGNYVGGSRGGVAIFHDNTISGYSTQPVFPLATFRTFMPAWGGATGRNPWDKNAPGGPFYSSTAAAVSSNLTVTVLGSPGWTTNQWAGYSVIRTTNLGGANDHGFSEIVSNTANSLTYHDCSSFGNALSFAKGDSLQIWKVSQAMDMPGVSGGALVTIGGSLSPLPSPPSGWNNQVVTPCYSWNNINLSNNNAHVNFGTSAGDAAIVVRGTHYFVDTKMPGYTPYTYPHPLTTGIAPPSNLTIVP